MQQPVLRADPGFCPVPLPAGVLIPLLWRHHLPLALCTFGLYNHVMLKPLADVLMCSPVAVSHTAAVYSMLDDTAYALGGLLTPYPTHRPPAASTRAQAYILALWCQLLLALLMPACYLYWTEFRWACPVGAGSRAPESLVGGQHKVAWQAREGPRLTLRWGRHQLPQRCLSCCAQAPCSPCRHVSCAGLCRSRSAFLRQHQQAAQTADASSPAASASSVRGPAGHHCSSPVVGMSAQPAPAQLVLVGAAFTILLLVLLWHFLHLCMAWLMPVLDLTGPHRLVAYVAAHHGLGASCFPAA